MNDRQCREYLRHITASGIKFGLHNVRKVLVALGHPERRYPSVLVAGTNGKGSVCAMLAEILALHGFSVGLFTSPHLVRVEERIRVGKEMIPSREFCSCLSQVKRTVDGLVRGGDLRSPLTYFETLSVCAFLYFARRGVDIAVLEVGMGGRLDATNVVTPLVSVITSVSRDHVEYLGRTLGQIAAEKAGIIKRRVPVVCGVGRGVAGGVIRRRARALQAPCLDVFGKEGALQASRAGRGFRFSFLWQGKRYRFSPHLAGKHQGKNGALAVAAALEIGRRWQPLDERKILRGINQAKWEGRLEVVRRRPLTVLDGAHNEEAAGAAAAYAAEFMPGPITLVFGIMKDKDIRRVTRCLFPVARTVVLTSVPYHRAATPEHIFSLSDVRGRTIFLEPDPVRAVEIAFRLTPASGSILITGSLFLVGELKRRRLFPA